MLTLALDTATAQVGVAVGRDGVPIAAVTLDAGRRHAEELVPTIRRMLAEADVTVAELAFVACGIGPGLFTGLRVGVTTARTLAQVLSVPVVGVPSLDLVAARWCGDGREVTALIDARRREVFSARYLPADEPAVPGALPTTVAPVDGYAVGPPADVADELAARGTPALVMGDGALAHADHFADLPGVTLLGVDAAAPDVGALVALATARFRRGDHGPPETLLPLYLRRSDAEILWDGR